MEEVVSLRPSLLRTAYLRSGPAQYEDKKSKSLMMLPTDMALIKDKSFKKFATQYAKSEDVFFKE